MVSRYQVLVAGVQIKFYRREALSSAVKYTTFIQVTAVAGKFPGAGGSA